MSIESGTNLVDLQHLWPLNGDPILEGDDHIRLIKAILKTQFPGEGGQGFDKPITATEDEINFLEGVTGNIQDQLSGAASSDALTAPSGTVMLFKQGTPPVGWTLDITDDNSMLRQVTALGGVSGGTDDPTSIDLDHVHVTAYHSLTIAQMPAHSHGYERRNGFQSVWGSTGNSSTGLSVDTTELEGGGEVHNHGDTEGVTDGLSFNPKYVNVIAAIKD